MKSELLRKINPIGRQYAENIGRRFATPDKKQGQAIAVLLGFTLKVARLAQIQLSVKAQKNLKEDIIMPRRGNIAKRDVLPDPVYNDKVVTKLVNQVMLDGKKGIAQGIVYDAFSAAAAKVGQEPMEMFNTALANIMPMVEVKARRVGGANYQVPIEIRAERRQTLAIRWLVAAARKRSERNMCDRLSAELVDAFNNTGNAVKKKEDTHRMAEANKAFAHYKF